MTTSSKMKPNNIEDIYPLSPMQQGILFHTLYAAEPETYLVQVAWTLRGAFDVEAWKRAWQEVFERHPALRTAFAWEKLAEPVQIVWKRLKVAFDEHDLRALPAAERAERAERYAADERRKGFDPTRAPLVRFGLLRLDERAYRFVWTMHHLLLDGWSTQTVVKEVFALYDALAKGAPARLPRAPRYGDYIGWLKKQDAAKDLAFWRNELAGFAAPTPFGIDRPAEGEPRSGHVRRVLPEASTAAIVAFAREHQITANTLLQGAWALLLSRYGREDDVVFGATVSGRSAPVAGIEGMVGLFINTLPVRVRVDRTQSAIAFLTALQQHQAELRDHEHSALAEVQRQSDVPRGTPLFESLVVFENFPLADSASKGSGERPALVIADSAAVEGPPYPLTLTGVLQRALQLTIGYDARRFDGAAVERMLGHLVTLIEGIVAEPKRAVGQLPLCTAAELAEMTRWNETTVAHAGAALLHRAVEEQVDRTPDAIAVVFEGATLTYRELDERANRLAHRLRVLGVGPDTLVGVCLDRSLDLPVALYGVLKAGGAYVPIDPGYPEDRIAYMLGDARAPVLLTDARLASRLPHGGATVIAVDADEALAASSAARPADVAIGPENLAYVIYTSGSTGRPKGVMIPHRAIVNHNRWFLRAYPFGPDRAVLQKTPVSFDASVWEFWVPLMAGARLVMARPGGHREPAYLVEAVIANGVTDLQLVPSMLEVLVEEPSLSRCVGLTRMFAGGEALSRALVDRFKARRAADVINLYGPTECTVEATSWIAEAAASGAMEPIGRPVDNVRLHVLDPGGEPLPIGVAGELHIAGACVGRGYFGRPDLTAERFVPDPWAGDPAARMYKTGDLCRLRADGVLEYVGRVDHQIKLRGFRIELGEIEAVLSAEPAVREAVVLLREDAPGDPRLVAYVVARGERPSASQLKAALAAKLPEHMVPSAFVLLDALPLTPGGKVDRRALPAPDAAALAPRDHVPPRSPVEQAIAGIFGEVLKLPQEQIGALDAFFDLGGHSLLAAQAVTRVRAAFGVDLAIRELFEAPTVAGLAARVEAALAGGSRPAVPPIVPVPRTGPLPLSFGQERLWFLSQLDPESPAYVISLALRLTGNLDVAALERALGELVRRHEVLRTTFASVDGKPVQVIHPPAPLPLPKESLAHLAREERDKAVRAEAEAEARRPFDLTAGPVIRAKLLELDGEDHVLLFTLHHAVSDGWTAGIINRELTALYGAFSRGEPSPLPELAVQYADYAAWQRSWLSGAVLDEQLAYWKKHLEGAPFVLELPTDRPRPPVQSFRGAQRMFRLSRELTAAVKELARREGATLYMTLLAAYDLLLHRHSGQSDILVGTPLAGRTRGETESLVGFFLNTQVVRARLAPEMTFKELLAQVKETALGAYAHQDMPFERLVQELAPEPDPSRSPLFQVIFNLQNTPREGLRLSGLKLQSAVAENATVKVDLTLIMGETPDGLVGRLEYSTDLFDASTIERFAKQLETLLAAVAKEPQKRLRELSALPEEERKRLLVAWNDTAVTYEDDPCFHELFEAQVDADPGALALVAKDARLTYGELEQRANRLAHHLRARGVGPDSVVGLCCARTADLVVGLLGILKAGGAYVPLDPAYPARRLVQILADAGATVAVTQAALAGKLREGEAALHPGEPARLALVQLDADAAAIAAESDARPEIELTPANLAYVLFTSGSTGAPKGVAIEHRQLVNYVRGVGARMALPTGATYAHVSTFSADLGNTVLFPPLATGGCLHLVPEELTTDPDGIGAYFAREGIDCLKIVPSHLSALLSGASPERVIPRKLLVLGGEASTWELIERIERLAPDCRIMNHYGPTETTVGVLTYPIERGKRVPNTAIVPLGRPLPNSRIYVLDASMEPTPTGVPGEVYIGGAGVARGYLNQPELTKERFVRDPWSTSPGARLYKTGDRARYLPDGTLLFLGRIDFQVKIRGFRIELGEIEAALSTCPGLKEAVVLVEEETPGDKRLVGYVVPSDPNPDLAGIRALLEQRLPDYMIPSAFVVLDALPLTPNGKIDRKALAAIERQRDKDAYVGPRNPVEEVLAAIWADVFDRERVGIHERFNDLGGHSLLAIQIVARARDAFQVQVPLRAIFEAPTIASLAERIVALQLEGDRLVAPPIERAPRDKPLPLSFTQERLWVLDRLEQGSSSYNVSSGTRLFGALDAGALERALREVVRRHEVLRTTFTLDGARPVQVIHPEVDLRAPVEDLSELPEAVREARLRAEAAAEASKPFDLEHGPLIRARLFRLSAEEHVLVVSMHHIVSDAQTQGVLGEEVAKLYDAFKKGLESPLPELPIQYADYAAWQRAWLSGEVLDKQLAYWKGALAGAPGVLDLPTDRPRPPHQSYRGARVVFQLPPAAKKALADLSKREGVTLFMTLLAAYDVLLHRWSGQRDIVVGTPAMNRTRAETEGLIGCFLNTLVLRAQIDEGLTFQELLQRVRETCLGAYAHQDMPFERLVQELAPERDLSRTPVFQVMFTLQTAGREDAGLTGVRRRALAAPIETAKFDLTLFAVDGPRGITCIFEYATDLFDAATVERMAAQLATLVEGIAAAPEQPIAALPILPEREREKLAVAWNATAADYERSATIASLVAAQAARTPDAIAVSFEGRALTYRELDERSNRLARHLQARGVGPETLVGIAVERSEAMVVGLLGILKAGGAYVPLDPTYPKDRLAFMAEDAGLRVLVTEAKLAGLVPEPAGGSVRLDTDAAAITGQSAAPLGVEALPESLAYVIYTSGSTGKPKGVAIPHRAVVNFLATMAREPGLAATDRLLAVTSLSFDIAGLELWLPLTVGARVEIASRATASDGAALARTLREAGITVMQATPSTFRLLIDAGWQGDRGLKVLVGGEAVPRELVDQLAERVGSVWNMYGPTETTIWSCVHRLAKDAPVLVGKPIANTRVYVLDPAGNLAPIGVPGELYIGGDGVARGYLHRPELTAERFVKDPFVDGQRVYRTGDLVRWRAEGAIEFLGRMDFQVKIRGFRIELGEIEAVLGQAPGVRQAVVMARDQGAMDKRLVAYVVPADAASPPALDDLRAALKARLPDHMVPSAFVIMASFPLTPAGKVDRRALPAPADATTATTRGFVAPRDEEEIRLAAIWREVLGLDKVGVTDSFFDLGGHSLLAVQMMDKLERAFGRKIPLIALFESQTIEALARLVRRPAAQKEEWPSMVAIRGTGTKRPLFLVARPNVNTLGYVALVRELGPDQPVYGLQLQYPEETTLGRPYTREERLAWAKNYISLIKAVQPEGPYFIAGMCEGTLIAFDMVQRLEEQGDEVGFFGVFDTWPEENTTIRWLHQLYTYQRTLQMLWRQPPEESYRYLRSRAGRLARTVIARVRPKAQVQGPVIRPRREQGEAWEVRMFPGPSWVPPKVKAHIDLFRVKKLVYWRVRDPEFGWGSRTTNGVDVHVIGGDHNTFLRGEHVPILARRLRETLDAAEEQIKAAALKRQRGALAAAPDREEKPRPAGEATTR
jgi:amino acid adenylation domain-containing protein